MKKYTVLKVATDKPDEEVVNIPSFLNAEGMCVVSVPNQDDVDKEYLQAGVVVFTDLEKTKEFRTKLTEDSEKQYPGVFKFPLVEIETVYSSLWKNSTGETEGKFYGYRILGEIE